jgi:hypothetical protein
MKRSITSVLASGLVSCALAIGASTASFAQSGAVAKADIPFAFQVGSKVMPAGTYIFSRDGLHVMQLHGATAKAQAISMVRPESNSTAPKLGRVTFNKYGDRYFLTTLSTANDSTSYAWVTSSQEKAIIRELKNEQANQVAVNVMPTLR